MRLGVYTDYVYHRDGGAVYAERAFALFLGSLATEFGRMSIAGRLAPPSSEARYPLPAEVDFAPLPYYASLTDLGAVSKAFLSSLRRFDKLLTGIDVAWLLGPSPLSVAFAVLTIARRKRLVLGVRQDYPEYLRSRHPGRPFIRASGALLDGCFRLMARRARVVVVGPQLAASYAHAQRLLEVSVSMVPERDVVSRAEVAQRDYGGELRVLSVGRLEEEKNPLLLAEILAKLLEDGRPWRLVVCGEGSLRESLERRLTELGVAQHAELVGYVPHGEALTELYRNSQFLLHVSWTEGLPQVIGEAFAAGLPTVATDVGGVAAAVGPAAALVPPGEIDPPVRELRRLAEDETERARLSGLATDWAREHSAERERERLVRFLERAE